MTLAGNDCKPGTASLSGFRCVVLTSFGEAIGLAMLSLDLWRAGPDRGNPDANTLGAATAGI